MYVWGLVEEIVLVLVYFGLVIGSGFLVIVGWGEVDFGGFYVIVEVEFVGDFYLVVIGVVLYFGVELFVGLVIGCECVVVDYG